MNALPYDSQDCHYRELRKFLNGEGKTTDKSKKNIINNKEIKGSYELNDDVVDEFFSLYESCVLSSRVSLSIQENPRTKLHSGIVFDFDPKYSSKDFKPLKPYIIKVDPLLKSKKDKDIAEEKEKRAQSKRCEIMNRFIINILDCMRNFEPFKELDTNDIDIFVTIKPKKDQIKESKKGFHVIIPQLKISIPFKKALLKALANNNKMKEYFKDCVNARIDVNDANEPINLESIVDQNLATNQVCLYGSSKVGSQSYILGYHYRVNFESESSFSLNLVPDFNNQDNLSRKMSIMYCHNERIIKCDKYDNIILDKRVKPNSIISNEQRLNNLRYTDPNTQFYVEIIDNINPKIFVNGSTWKMFVKALASMSPNYKPLAIYGSQKCMEEFNKPNTKKIIDEIFDTEEISGWGKGKLINWLKDYKPNKLEFIRLNDIGTKVLSSAYETQGEFSDDRISEILMLLYDSTFISTYDRCTSLICWYEMIKSGPHAFKWFSHPFNATNNVPAVLMNRVGNDVRSSLNEGIISLTKRMAGETGDTAKEIREMIVKIRKVQNKYENYGPKNTVIKNTSYQLLCNEFIDEIDKYPGAIGVNGGVLLLPTVYKQGKTRRAKFINSENDYKVSINTKRDWKPYDENDPDIIEVHKVLREGFYIDAKLAKKKAGKGPVLDYDKESYDFYFFHIARGLLNIQQDPHILHVWGEGSNLKSLLNSLNGSALTSDLTMTVKADYLSEDVPNSSSPNPVAMQMINKRHCSFTETEKGRTLNESKMKWLTSPSESKSMRALYKNNIQVLLTCVYTSYSNHLLTINGTDNGIWRRQLYYRLKRVFKPDPDPSIPWESKENTYYLQSWSSKTRILNAYFRILVHYCEMYINDYQGKLNLVPHEIIAKQTSEIRKQYDLLERFIECKLIKKEGSILELNTLVNAYKDYYRAVDGSMELYNKTVIDKLKNSSLVFTKEDILLDYEFA